MDLERLRPMEAVGAKHVDGLEDNAIRQGNPKALQSIVVVTDAVSMNFGVK